jgi:adenosylcobyric acid synthase
MVLGTSSGAQKLGGHGAVRLLPQPGPEGCAVQGAEHEQQRARCCHAEGRWGEIGTAQYLQALAAGPCPMCA